MRCATAIENAIAPSVTSQHCNRGPMNTRLKSWHFKQKAFDYVLDLSKRIWRKPLCSLFDGGLKVGWTTLNQMLDSGSKVRPGTRSLDPRWCPLMDWDAQPCTLPLQRKQNWGKFPGASNISAKLSKLKPDGEKGDWWHLTWLTPARARARGEIGEIKAATDAESGRGQVPQRENFLRERINYKRLTCWPPPPPPGAPPCQPALPSPSQINYKRLTCSAFGRRFVHLPAFPPWRFIAIIGQTDNVDAETDVNDVSWYNIVLKVKVCAGRNARDRARERKSGKQH